MKIVICLCYYDRPHAACYNGLKEACEALQEAGHSVGIVLERGSPYISKARCDAVMSAYATRPDAIMLLDHDVSAPPEAFIRLLATNGDVVAGMYRYKWSIEDYMGKIPLGDDGRPLTIRDDGCIAASGVPAGFMKLTPACIDRLLAAYPELIFGEYENDDDFGFDLFRHGADRGLWYGEDYAFCRRWREIGGEIWVIPDLDIAHWGTCVDFGGPYRPFIGNLHRFLISRAQEKAA